MARPVYIWRLDELENKRTLRVNADGSQLKILTETYRVWLNYGMVDVEEKQEDGSWRSVERYKAKVGPGLVDQVVTFDK